MYKRSALFSVLIFGLFSRMVFASGPDPVLTGTVNIVLANANGMVVLTDSNQTVRSPAGEPSISPLPGQKLFRLDNSTVCTIAGFGSRPLSGYPELSTSAAGVLDRYIRELQSTGETHSFSEKLTSLAFLFESLLSAVGNLQHLDRGQIGDYGFESILAGYDADGTARIGKLVFGTSLSTDGVFSPVMKQLSGKTVGQELVYEKAGIGGAAVENILEYPAQLADEPEIGRYARSRASDRGSSLTTVEMEALAKSLARHSALVNSVYVSGFRKVWPVGGRDQVAILEKGTIKSLDQPTPSFEPRRLDMRPFSIVMHFTSTGSTPPSTDFILANSSKVVLVLKSSFRGGRVRLDDAYYFQDDFSNATIYYNGGVLGFDSSNRVTDCVLSLGPHVDRKSAAVQELIARFPWKAVQ